MFVGLNNVAEGFNDMGTGAFIDPENVCAIEGFKKQDNKFSVVYLKSGHSIKVLGEPYYLLKQMFEPPPNQALYRKDKKNDSLPTVGDSQQSP